MGGGGSRKKMPKFNGGRVLQASAFPPAEFLDLGVANEGWVTGKGIKRWGSRESLWSGRGEFPADAVSAPIPFKTYAVKNGNHKAARGTFRKSALIGVLHVCKFKI